MSAIRYAFRGIHCIVGIVFPFTFLFNVYKRFLYYDLNVFNVFSYCLLNVFLHLCLKPNRHFFFVKYYTGMSQGNMPTVYSACICYHEGSVIFNSETVCWRRPNCACVALPASNKYV